MARRKLPTLATGSMADIAFLLLVFWLMTTTLDTDIGILRILPDLEETNLNEIDEQDVLEVFVNKNNEILVEDEIIEISELKNIARSFLVNSGVFEEEEGNEKYTFRRMVTKEKVEQKIAQYSEGRSYSLLIRTRDLSDTLKVWVNKMTAIKFFGEYRELKPDAAISIQNDKGTSYDQYIQVQNELAQALNELREELSLKFFKKPFKELDRIEEQDKIIAIQKIYPQRISEADIVDNR